VFLLFAVMIAVGVLADVVALGIIVDFSASRWR
jgi:hypothetical protein